MVDILTHPEIVMIHVKRNRIKYWQKEDQREIKL